MWAAVCLQAQTVKTDVKSEARTLNVQYYFQWPAGGDHYAYRVLLSCDVSLTGHQAVSQILLTCQFEAL